MPQNQFPYFGASDDRDPRWVSTSLRVDFTRWGTEMKECSGLETPILGLREMGCKINHMSSTEYASAPQR